MDAITASAWTSVVLLVVFVGIVLWAWSAARKPAFDEAARMPLQEIDDEPRARDGRAPR